MTCAAARDCSFRCWPRSAACCRCPAATTASCASCAGTESAHLREQAVELDGDHLDGRGRGQQEMRVECGSREFFVRKTRQLGGAGAQDAELQALRHAGGTLRGKAQLLPGGGITGNELRHVAPHLLHVARRALQEKLDELSALVVR